MATPWHRRDVENEDGDATYRTAAARSSGVTIPLITRIAFGTKIVDALIALVMLCLGGHRPQLPGRHPHGPRVCQEGPGNAPKLKIDGVRTIRASVDDAEDRRAAALADFLADSELGGHQRTAVAAHDQGGRLG